MIPTERFWMRWSPIRRKLRREGTILRLRAFNRRTKCPQPFPCVLPSNWDLGKHAFLTFALSTSSAEHFKQPITVNNCFIVLTITRCPYKPACLTNKHMSNLCTEIPWRFPNCPEHRRTHLLKLIGSSLSSGVVGAVIASSSMSRCHPNRRPKFDSHHFADGRLWLRKVGRTNWWFMLKAAMRSAFLPLEKKWYPWNPWCWRRGLHAYPYWHNPKKHCK